MSTGISLPNSQLLLLMLLTVPASRSEKNVALTGTATQSADQDSSWTADKAIDDCTSNNIPSDCCAHTKVKGAKKAWWRVDLGEPRTIQYITIHNRQNAKGRFAGYQLFLSNTTNYQQGIICYKDNSIEVADLQMDPTHQCPYVAQYVTIYNHRDDTNRPSWYDDYAVLELCEVQVFGCTSGKYGNGNCDNTCPQKCFGGNCDAIKGHCFYCFAGRFGDGCDQHCSNNCSSACEKDSGHCLGCIPGKRGELCNNRCPSTCVTCHQKSEQCFECVHGKYGNLCELDCSENCKNKSCGKDSGHCLECILGKRGDLCDTSCPINCVTCDQTSPECFGCIHGKYGQDCTLDCLGICKNNACQQSGGECTACPPGKYGSLCNKNCSTNCFECDFSSGACDGMFLD
ncbi:scavenger receptor class F member 2-like [Ylistrum balloti]|uniref:scavenger receptor class F member 2-like n=1 Tax=Ylistrum balloti TaxID=509963 RepID=UPI0029057FFA|nr:scavenger receptor class F member 2-like [Ylistrum balloti]